jgi:predicted PurR-regulated permease PerM
MTTPQERYERWRTTAIIVWASIGVLILAGVALWGVGKISAALVPFVIAFVIAFLLNWPVRALAERGVSRSVAVLICFAVTILVLGAVFTLLGPSIGHQATSLTHNLPGYVARLDHAESMVESRVSGVVFPQWLAGVIKTVSAQASQGTVAVGNAAGRALLNAGGGIAVGFLDVFLAFVIAFWALADMPKIREEIIVLAGPKYEEDAEHLLTTVVRVVGGYLRGQSIASLTTGTLAALGLSLLHVPYAIVVGVIAFFLNFAPYIGPFITATIAGLLGLFISPLTAVGAVVVIVVAQNFTDIVVVPRVMSAQVDLHPTLVIFSLLVGGTLFGVAGILFAIPVAATCKGLFVYYYERRTERQLSTENGALFRGRPAPASATASDPTTSDDDLPNTPPENRVRSQE